MPRGWSGQPRSLLQLTSCGGRDQHPCPIASLLGFSRRVDSLHRSLFPGRSSRTCTPPLPAGTGKTAPALFEERAQGMMSRLLSGAAEYQCRAGLPMRDLAEDRPDRPATVPGSHDQCGPNSGRSFQSGLRSGRPLDEFPAGTSSPGVGKPISSILAGPRIPSFILAEVRLQSTPSGRRPTRSARRRVHAAAQVEFQG